MDALDNSDNEHSNKKGAKARVQGCKGARVQGCKGARGQAAHRTRRRRLGRKPVVDGNHQAAVRLGSHRAGEGSSLHGGGARRAPSDLRTCRKVGR